MVYDEKKLIVMEDSNVMRQITKKNLKEMVFGNIPDVEDGAAGLKKLGDGAMDLVVSGWDMPIMTGIEFIKAERADAELKDTELNFFIIALILFGLFIIVWGSYFFYNETPVKFGDFQVGNWEETATPQSDVLQSKNTNDEERKLLKEEIKILKNKLHFISISASDISFFDQKKPDSELNKNQLIKLKKQYDTAQDFEKYENHYAYKLFKIELLIPQNGGSSIDTSIGGKERKGAYERIQDVLRGIKYYKGAITGDQGSTFEAVKKFQIDQNERANTKIFNPEHFGLFGYRTLEAIRTFYKLKKDTVPQRSESL